MLDHICNSLLVKPQICNNVFEKKKHIIIDGGKRNFWWYVRVTFFILGCSLVLLVVVYILYKMKLRSEFKQKAAEEVDNALSKYYHNNKGYSATEED